MDCDQLNEELGRLAGVDRFSGVVLIQQSGQTVYEASYGLANRSWQVPCSIESRFDTASITKLFTAVAALQVICDEGFQLDTDVVDYLGLGGTALPTGVTPFHLLTHTSGIADDADEEAGENYADLWRDRPNYTVRETRDLLAQFSFKKPNFAPGTDCRYCNCGYVLLGLMIEKATARPYREYIADRVFGPAGMIRSGFFAMDEIADEVAEGADPISKAGTIVGWRKNIYSYPPIGSPDGGAYVTAGDLLKFHAALVNGQLLDSATTMAMLSPKVPYRPAGREPRQMGFGLQFQTEPNGQIRSYWKDGINAGASGILAHYPTSDVTVVVLSNMEQGAWETFQIIDRMAAPPLTDSGEAS